MSVIADELDTFINRNCYFYDCISKTSIINLRNVMAILTGFLKLSWKDKQIAAINRLSKAKGWPFSDNNPYFERVYNVIHNEKIKTKAQMKQELKKHGYK